MAGKKPSKWDKSQASPSKWGKSQASPSKQGKSQASPSKWDKSQSEPSKWDKSQAAPSKWDSQQTNPSSGMGKGKRIDGSESSIHQYPEASRLGDKRMLPTSGKADSTERNVMREVPAFNRPADFPEESIPEETAVLTPISFLLLSGNKVKILFQAAKLIEFSWQEAGKEHDVTINGVTIDGREDSEIEVEEGAVFYARLDTTSRGVVTSFAITTKKPEDPERHHVPPSQEGAPITGIYIWEVGTIDISASGVPIWVPHQASLVWCDYTRENVNKGRGARVSIKTTADAEDWWRSFVGDEVDDYNSGDSPKIHTTVVEKPIEDENGGVIVGETSVEIETTSEPRGATGIFYLLESCDSESVTEALEFENGMLKTIHSGPFQLGECNAGGSGTLPAGTEGQMLYHNGTTWVVLAAPAAPTSGTVNIMTHSGTVPAWVNKTIGTHSVCVSGTPTATDFIEL